MFDEALKQAKKARVAETSLNKSDKKAEIVEAFKPASKKKKSSGKRTDPDFKQVGAYIRKNTYLKIQRLLLEQPNKDFSDLVEELLTNYINNQLTD
jgi:hypothetical protein